MSIATMCLLIARVFLKSLQCACLLTTVFLKSLQCVCLLPKCPVRALRNRSHLNACHRSVPFMSPHVLAQAHPTMSYIPLVSPIVHVCRILQINLCTYGRWPYDWIPTDKSFHTYLMPLFMWCGAYSQLSTSRNGREPSPSLLQQCIW